MFYIFADRFSLRLLALCHVSDRTSVSWHFFAGRIYRRTDDGSICLHTSGILPGDRVGLVGPPRVITSVHDGHGVRAVHREFQPTAAADTAVPLRPVPEHQNFIVQVFIEIISLSPMRTITTVHCPHFPLIVIVFCHGLYNVYSRI
jgi:hypothetical protein